MQVFLETERLVLRRFTKADVDNLFDLDSDPEVMRFLTGGTPTPRDVLRNETLPRFLHYYERFEGFGFWAAIEKSTGEFLGWFEFRPPEGSGPDEVELGYRLRKSAWGKGYATEGSRALIRKGFSEHGVRRVVAETMAINIASRRVMEKASLTLERIFHQEWQIRSDEESHPNSQRNAGRTARRICTAVQEMDRFRGDSAAVEGFQHAQPSWGRVDSATW